MRLSLTHGSDQGCGCCPGLSECQFPLCCLCWLDPFVHPTASWAAQSLSAPPGPTEKAPSYATAGAGAHVLSCLCSGHCSPPPGFSSQSLISTHCRALSSLKGLWDMGHSVSLPSPNFCRKKQRDVSSRSGQVEYLCLSQKLMTKSPLRVTHILPGVCLRS